MGGWGRRGTWQGGVRSRVEKRGWVEWERDLGGGKKVG